MANSVDPDQTAVWFRSALFACTCLSEKLRLITVGYKAAVLQLQSFSWVSRAESPFDQYHFDDPQNQEYAIKESDAS